MDYLVQIDIAIMYISVIALISISFMQVIWDSANIVVGYEFIFRILEVSFIIALLYSFRPAPKQEIEKNVDSSTLTTFTTYNSSKSVEISTFTTNSSTNI